MFKAILFDLDNTLIDREAAFRACLPAAAEARLLELDERGQGDRGALFAEWNRYEMMDQQTLTRRLCGHLRPDPELLKALQELAKSKTLAVVTNGGSQTQRAKIAATGMDGLFSGVFISEEVGFAKPDPRIFLHAVQRLALSPGDCLYLGDHPPVDEPGARAAGLAFLRVDRPLTPARLQAQAIMTRWDESSFWDCCCW